MSLWRPATADLLARAAAGMAGDLLTAVLLTARCPVVFAPAMHTEMWEHAATQADVATLRARGAVVLDPAAGRLTGADSGPGRLPDPAELFRVANRLLARGAAGLAADLTGRQVVVSAGRDQGGAGPGPVPRQLVVRAAGLRAGRYRGRARGQGHPGRGQHRAGRPGRRTVRAGRFRGRDSGKRCWAAAGADAVVMAAAVADYRPAARAGTKLKKTGGAPEPIELAENPDILRELAAAGRRRAGHRRVRRGDRGRLLANGQAKLAAKGCDLLVVNQVGGGLAFGTSDNAAVILAADGGRSTCRVARRKSWRTSSGTRSPRGYLADQRGWRRRLELSASPTREM